MGVRVFAPASVANLAVGYDTLGLCLEGPGDEVAADFVDVPGVRIAEITGAKGKLPLEVQKNTAGRAALATCEAYGELNRGIELRIHKKMPFGSGMGSSSASAVAGAMAVNELLGQPFDKRQLLRFAAMGEQVADDAWHLDNVAPSMLGGIVLVRDAETCDVQTLVIPAGLRVVVVHPDVQILTRDARAVLSDTVSLELMIRQQANLGGFIIGLYQNDMQLIQRSLHDLVIEPQRARLIPGFAAVKAAALDAGVLGCSISGAGPSVFALCQDTGIATVAGTAMQAAFATAGLKSTVYHSAIHPQGAHLC